MEQASGRLPVILERLHAGDRIDGAKVTVMGLGNFGGGAGVTRWLCELGAKVLVTDAAKPETLQAGLAEIQNLIDRRDVTLRLGEHNKSDFTSSDLVVANPAIPLPWTNEYITYALEAGVPVTTEIRLVTERLPRGAVVVGITGSAGKSTTSAMIAHVLNHYLSHKPTLHATNEPDTRGANTVLFGGNIGGSLLPLLGSECKSKVVVLELSSAMLYWLGRGVGYAQARGFSPDIGLITNLKNNHTDWHGSFEHYATSKMQMFRFDDSRCDARKLTSMQSFTCEGSEAMRGRFALVGKRPREINIHGADPSLVANLRDRLLVPGEHNVTNALAAVTVAHAVLTQMGVAVAHPALLTESLATFKGLPHRLQLAAEVRGVKYYNDSKATTPESCLLALEAFAGNVDSRRIHLIAGGYDKKSDLAALHLAACRLGGLYTVGATGPGLAAGATAAGAAHSEYCDTLPQAMRAVQERVQPGDIVLLSPACASWGQFRNYEERGELFCSLAGQM
jgi:UDP-N-acetylmuramoylalanine--D-glutamate ligase